MLLTKLLKVVDEAPESMDEFIVCELKL